MSTTIGHHGNCTYLRLMLFPQLTKSFLGLLRRLLQLLSFLRKAIPLARRDVDLSLLLVDLVGPRLELLLLDLDLVMENLRPICRPTA